jgi:hypothetical protein
VNCGHGRDKTFGSGEGLKHWENGSRHVQPTRYRICVRGRLTERFARAVEGMQMTSSGDETIFVGVVHDQSQLYGILDRLRDLGLELLCLSRNTIDTASDDDERGDAQL